NTNVTQITATPGYPATAGAPGMVTSTPMEGGVSDVNGTPGAAGVGPGIWRMQNGVWFNMTGFVSTKRSGVPTTAAVPGNQGANPTASATGVATIPNTPGPDDDYRRFFPSSGATWTDIALIYTDTTNIGLPFTAPVLYAALGTTPGATPGAATPGA